MSFVADILTCITLRSPWHLRQRFIQINFSGLFWKEVDSSHKQRQRTNQVFRHENNHSFCLCCINLAWNFLFPRDVIWVLHYLAAVWGLCSLMELSQEKSAPSILSGAVTHWFLHPNQTVCLCVFEVSLFMKATKTMETVLRSQPLPPSGQTDGTHAFVAGDHNCYCHKQEV